MDKIPNKSTETKLRSRPTGKSSLYQGGVIVLLIAITPFLFYSYKSFPSDTQVWETSFFTFKTEYNSLNLYFWFLTGKIIPIYLLLFWFFTCKHWWHWIILVPLAMYFFQLISILNDNNKFVDEVELIYLLPLMMILIPSVYLIRSKLFNKVRGNDLEDFEEDLMLKKTTWQQLKDLFR